MNRATLAAALIAIPTLTPSLLAAPQEMGESIEGIQPIVLTTGDGHRGNDGGTTGWTAGISPMQVAKASEASIEFAKASLAHARVILEEGLGNPWRADYEASPGKPQHVYIWINGPVELTPESNALAAEAMRSSYEAAREGTFAEALPAGPARDRAAELAKAAQERATKAMERLRGETRVIELRASVGEEIALALKAAIPNGTFAQVGGSSVLATGSKRDIDAAEALARELDARAQAQHDESMAQIQRRTVDTPVGRLLGKPLTIEFQGGAITQYLSAIADAAGAESWVVEDERIGGAYIPPIKLTGVTADSAVKMLDGMSVKVADANGTLARQVPLMVMRIDPDVAGVGSPPIYRVSAALESSPQRAGGPVEMPKRTQVFDVALTQWRDEPEGEAKTKKAHDALLSAIETGVGLNGPSQTFKVKLHPPSGMLFATGTTEELVLVDNIVRQWSSTQ